MNDDQGQKPTVVCLTQLGSKEMLGRETALSLSQRKVMKHPQIVTKRLQFRCGYSPILERLLTDCGRRLASLLFVNLGQTLEDRLGLCLQPQNAQAPEDSRDP